MEPTQQENTFPESATPVNRKRAVVSPMLSLPNRPRETNKNTAIRLPVADISTRALHEDGTGSHTMPTTSTSIATPSTSTEVPSLNRGGGSEKERRTPAPLFHKQSVPVVNTPEPTKQKEPLPPKLVRVLPVKGRSSGYSRSSPFAQPTESYRWEQQTSRYPTELLELMQAETRCYRLWRSLPLNPLLHRQRRGLSVIRKSDVFQK